MIKKAFETSIDYLQILDETGTIDSQQMSDSITDSLALEMYRNMKFARAFDAKALSLQRQGRIVTYAPLLGEEATQIGTALAMRKQDIFLPNFRQHGVYMARGTPLDLLFLYWRGFEEGMKLPRELNAYPYIVPVATQMPHAAGVALAQKLTKSNSVVLGFVGDGGTSEGDFYECINFAGALKLPLVTIIENNQWAISLPRKMQTATETLAQKAVAAGIPAIQVDGNDVFAVYKATMSAIQGAQAGMPSLIECVTYRMGIHTTSDDPTKYRSDEEVAIWLKRDPIARLKTYLTKKNLLNDDIEKKMDDDQSKTIDAAVAKAEEFKPDPKSILNSMYSYMPDVLKDELDDAVNSNFWQDAGMK